MDLESILATIQPFVIMFAALFAAFLTAVWVSVVIWTFRDIRSRSRDVFAQILATLMVLVFFPFFPFPGLILYLLLRPRETLAEIYERSLEEETLLQGIEERLACPGCNRRIEEEFMICPTCHTRLKKACPACGRLLHLRWNICPYCGAVQTTAKPAPALASQPVPMPIEPAAEALKLSSASPSGLPEPASEAQTDPLQQEEYEPPSWGAQAEPSWEEGAEPATGAEPEPTDERPADPASQTETLPFEFD
jgi:RNA polymerase subunit RPABC4/transcription elongation factor Spt4